MAAVAQNFATRFTGGENLNNGNTSPAIAGPALNSGVRSLTDTTNLANNEANNYHLKTEWVKASSRPVGATEVADIQGRRSGLDLRTQADPVLRSQPQLRVGQKTVDATVGEIFEMWVTFDCVTPSGKMPIRLPRDIVPHELLAYGQPVRISLNSASGMRVPEIQRRDPDLSRIRRDNEIDEWLKTL